MKTSTLAGLPALLILLMLPSCCGTLTPEIRVRRSETLSNHESARESKAAGDSLGTVVIPRDGLFLTAVDYPSGYDWRRDTARSDVRGRVLLLRLRDDAGPPSALATTCVPAAFDTILALEAGAGRAVSLDPDRHQFIGGHLYTQCITETGTVWRRDGRTVLLSPEREYLRGILPSDSTIWTLAQRLEGAGGFVLRRNTQPLLQRTGGRIHGSTGDFLFGAAGALSPDGDEACFLYQDEAGGWHHVRGREDNAVPLPAKLAAIYDARCFDGTVVLAGRGTNRHEPVLYADGARADWSVLLGTAASFSGYRLLRSGGEVSVVGTFILTLTGRSYSARWRDGRILDVREGRRDWLDSGAYLLRQDGRLTVAHHGGTDYALDESATLMMPACACVRADALWLALTVYGSPVGAGDDGGAGANGGTGAEAVLWVNGRQIPVGLNGFLTSVTLLE